MSTGAGWYAHPSNPVLDIYWNGVKWSGSRLRSRASADQPAAPSGTPLPAAPPAHLAAKQPAARPAAATQRSHGLGVGHGGITDYGNGVIEYRASGKILPAFRVNVSDVTGFSVRRPNRQDKRAGAGSFQQIFVLQGGGTELASCPVSYGTSEMLEAWIRKHPSFRGNVPVSAPAPAPAAPAPVAAPSLVDELTKLGQLRDTGVLTPEQFEQAKMKLLG